MSSMPPGNSEAARVAQAQLDAYNARDIEAFVVCYHVDVEVFDLHSGALRFAGRDAMRARYGAQFDACPDLHAALVNRIATEGTSVDHEEVVGLVEGEVVEAIAIYQVEDGLIRRVWFAK